MWVLPNISERFLQNNSGWLLLPNTFFCSLRQPQPKKLFPSALVNLNILETNTVNCLRTAHCGGPSQLRLCWFIANRASDMSEMWLEIGSSPEKDWRFPVNIQYMNVFFHFYFFASERQQQLSMVFICCKTKLKKKIFLFWKSMFFTKYTLFADKMFLYGKKSFILKFFFTEKNFFYREKNKWKCKKYISHLKNIFLYLKCLFYKQNINLS